MAERTIGLRLQLNGVTQTISSIQDLEKELQLAKEDLKELEIGSNNFKVLAREISNAETQLESLNKQSQGINLEKQIEGFGKLTGGITAGFAAAGAAAQLFGRNTEDVTKAAAQAQNLLTVALGARAAAETFTGAKILLTTVATKAQTLATIGATGAIRALWAAMLANPITALLALVGALVSAYFALSAATDKAKLSQEQFNDLSLKTRNLIRDTTSSIGQYNNQIAQTTELLGLQGASLQEIFEVTQRLRAEQIAAAEENIRKINEQIDAYKKQMVAYDLINPLIEKSKELEEQLAELRRLSNAEQLRNQNRLIEVERTNQRRRNELLTEELQLRLGELRLSYKQERELAIKNGEDIVLIDKKYYKDRKKILEDFGKSYLEKTNSIYLKLGELIGGDFLFRLNLLKENQLKEEKELIEQNENRLKILKKGSQEYEKALEKNDLNLRALIAKNALELNKFIETNAKSGYKVLLELEKEYNEDFINEVKKRLGVTETLEKFSIDSFRREYAEKTELNRIFLQNSLNAESERFFQNALLGKAETERQKKLVEGIKKIREENANDEEKTDKELLNLKLKYYEESEKFALNYYDEVTKKGQKFLENQILIDIRLSQIAKEETMERLKLEEMYFSGVLQLQEKYVNDDSKFKEKSKKQELSFQLDLLAIQRDALKNKLEILEQDPTLNAEKLQQIKNELLKVEVDYNNKVREISQTTADLNEQKFQESLRKISDAVNVFSNLVNQLSTLSQQNFSFQLERLEIDYQNSMDRIVGDTAEANAKREELEKIFQKQKRAIEREAQLSSLRFTLATTIANAAAAVVNTLATVPAPANAILATVQGAISAAQVAIIGQQIAFLQSQPLARGGFVRGNSHEQGGVKYQAGGVELEGNEAVINRRSTLRYSGLLSQINESGGGRPLLVSNIMDSRLAEVLSTAKSEPIRAYVLEQDITKSQTINRRLEDLATF